MAFNIFSTLNQNLQNFWGDAYDAYQAWKNKVGNVASTINNNLQDFWGDIYDVGSTIKRTYPTSEHKPTTKESKQ